MLSLRTLCSVPSSNGRIRKCGTVDNCEEKNMYIYIYVYELVLVCEIQKSAQCHIETGKCVSYNIPKKLTTTVCFIQKESSGGRQPEDSFWMKQTVVVGF